MTGIGWSIVIIMTHRLAPEESEAVLGDLVEAREGVWRCAIDILGLVLRREAAHWHDWRPWVAGLGLAFPASFLLMGASLSVITSIQRMTVASVPGHQTTNLHNPTYIGCQLAMLLVWSWTGGFAVGSLSRRTVWASVLSYLVPCMFCLSRFRIPEMSGFSLLLFVAPAAAGIYYGIHVRRLSVKPAITIALTVTALMTAWWFNERLYALDWVLVLPAWYIAASSWRKLSTA